jgi:hypothetical protein
MKVTYLQNCRCCKSEDLSALFSLGEQHLTGVFPKQGEAQPPKAPLNLILCKNCGLVQLEHSCSPEFLYGPTYGYRSGLNGSMRAHLRQTADYLSSYIEFQSGDVICDIGCNDGTLLKYFLIDGLKKIGIDPLASKFSEFHPEGLVVCSDFFSRDSFLNISSQPAKLITSLSMFYDLEDPVAFVRDINACLMDDGIWFFEQSYLLLMLKTNSFDTICHEHLEYYSLSVIEFILREAGMKIVDLSLNDVNGGSMAVTAVKIGSDRVITQRATKLLEDEKSYGLTKRETYQVFIERCIKYGRELRKKLDEIRSLGLSVAGYGASTKGNVLLQYLGISDQDLPFILEINEDKRGRVTPGSGIPIRIEDDVDVSKIDYLVVFPWHFRDNIIEKEQAFINAGGRFIFPLPAMEIFPAEN